jgi:hypothetical protein
MLRTYFLGFLLFFLLFLGFLLFFLLFLVLTKKIKKWSQNLGSNRCPIYTILKEQRFVKCFA